MGRTQAAGLQALRVHEDQEQEVPLGRRKPHTPPQPTHQRPPRRLRDRRGTPLKKPTNSFLFSNKNQKIPFKHNLDIVRPVLFVEMTYFQSDDSEYIRSIQLH